MARRRRSRPRLSWGIIAWLLALTVIGAAAGLYTFARITYRVAVGPEGGEDQRIFAALNPIFAIESSLIRLVAVPTSDPHATARTLEAGEVDLAIIRPDLAVPANGRTIARRNPTLEKLEIARGALQGSPAVPDETITTLAVTRRLVARSSIFDWPAGEIARSAWPMRRSEAALTGTSMTRRRTRPTACSPCCRRRVAPMRSDWICSSAKRTGCCNGRCTGGRTMPWTKNGFDF
jgi:hypothetical protein